MIEDQALLHSSKNKNTWISSYLVKDEPNIHAQVVLTLDDAKFLVAMDFLVENKIS